jgi:hypothetical protein
MASSGSDSRSSQFREVGVCSLIAQIAAGGGYEQHDKNDSGGRVAYMTRLLVHDATASLRNATPVLGQRELEFLWHALSMSDNAPTGARSRRRDVLSVKLGKQLLSCTHQIFATASLVE